MDLLLFSMLDQFCFTAAAFNNVRVFKARADAASGPYRNVGFLLFYSINLFNVNYVMKRRGYRLRNFAPFSVVN